MENWQPTALDALGLSREMVDPSGEEGRGKAAAVKLWVFYCIVENALTHRLHAASSKYRAQQPPWRVEKGRVKYTAVLL